MKKYYFCLGFILAFVIVGHPAYAQNDYIVTIENDTIKNITITGVPGSLEKYGVNVYNENLMPKYEDYKLIYTTAKSKKPQDILYNEVKSYYANGIFYRSLHSRKIPLVDGMVVFDTIVEAPGKTKEELYSSIRNAIIIGLSLTADQIQKTLVEDKEGGTIMIRKLIDFSISQGKFNSFIYYDVAFRVKDNKARLTVGNIAYHYEKGQIFNDAARLAYDVKAEVFTKGWRSGNNIKSHYYKATLLTFFSIEERLIANFVQVCKKPKTDDNW
ncbi:MAG: hypothetical protein H6Q22_1089 [Bacteroidetes bacterium]|nr:hypothetical protein [Bacteroidota bacterium]